MPADIRTARASDIDALVAIENTVFEADRISRRSFRRLIDADTATLLVAESSIGIAGYCVVLFRRGSAKARLYSIAAGAGSEGAGVGGALLSAAERTARDRGCRLLRLEVRADNNRARALYERRGYSRTGDVPGYYADGATALRYLKEFPDDGADAHPGDRAGRERRSA
jgi:[ribosomal protein S18]-alanine N-acetyltransferase